MRPSSVTLPASQAVEEVDEHEREDRRPERGLERRPQVEAEGHGAHRRGGAQQRRGRFAQPKDEPGHCGGQDPDQDRALDSAALEDGHQQQAGHPHEDRGAELAEAHQNRVVLHDELEVLQPDEGDEQPDAWPRV
jgi:hypothetical protein